jgi:SAM-dependent methyltransferase
VTNLVPVYDAGDEDARMVDDRNAVEWLRSQELLRRWLPPAPGLILDIGGATGRYAGWLETRGYAVRLLDLVPKHVALARSRGIAALVGDARHLPFATESADAVVMLGPLYHLPDPDDRAAALAEAARCVKPGGVVVAAAMSRWAKACVRSSRGELGDVVIQEHLLRVFAHGQDRQGDAFDRASYNHDPRELEDELRAAGLTDVRALGVEGPLGAEARADVRLNDVALRAARLAETSAPHFSIHLLVRGAKRAAPARR